MRFEILVLLEFNLPFHETDFILLRFVIESGCLNFAKDVVLLNIVIFIDSLFYNFEFVKQFLLKSVYENIGKVNFLESNINLDLLYFDICMCMK